jgi:hypothetical protein
MFADINGIPVVRLDVNSNYKNASRTMTFSHPYSTGWDVGTAVTGNITVGGVTTKMFYGTIKAIVRRRPENTYEFTCHDILSRAVEYWFTPPTADGAWERRNITHIALVQDILSEASISGASFSNDWPAWNKYTDQATATFSFGVGSEPVQIKVAAAWDVISWICTITGCHVYADSNGVVHLDLIWDETTSSDIISHYFSTGNTGGMKTVEYIRSDENLRNEVIVYGGGILSSASAVSPWLPPGFYRTAVISHELIETQADADLTASINLHRLNRLTESCIVEVLGKTDIDVRQIVNITDPNANVSGNWFVTQCRHTISERGYVTRITGVR